MGWSSSRFLAMYAPGNLRMRFQRCRRSAGLIADSTLYAALKPDGRYVQALWLSRAAGPPGFDRFNPR
jgi:hypothetical protein